ncbi:MAG: TIGR02677 family protein [Peptococcaceae bacterium]|nr:TIGR02677 family protein [Peptococcaceae bacterium]
MKVSDKLIRPITEVKYLAAENASRYRVIMRIFYESHERLRYWLDPDEVYAQMKEAPLFSAYTFELCQQDLTQLVEWGNLHAMQDMRNVKSLEAFNNKRYRYQMSAYSIEIERLAVRLENLDVEGASLEPKLLERIRQHIEHFGEWIDMSDNDCYAQWKNLKSDFERLNQNCSDYFHDLSNIDAKTMTQMQEFMVFKDRLIDYLNHFIRGLQHNLGAMDEALGRIAPEMKNAVFEKIMQQILLNPLAKEQTSEAIYAQLEGTYQSMVRWFTSKDGQDGEALRLFDVTNEAIRKITRYAQAISERNVMGVNRLEEYRHLADMFLQCADMDEAHKLSAMAFGLERPVHFKAEIEKEHESVNAGVYEQTPCALLLNPRTRHFREKQRRTMIRDFEHEKRAAKEAYLDVQSAKLSKLRALEKGGRIDFATLPEIDADVRETLLKWLTQALEDESMARTEDGRRFKLDNTHATERCILNCEDGNLSMPHYELVFMEDER